MNNMKHLKLYEEIKFTTDQKEQIISAMEQIEINLFDSGVKREVVAATRKEMDDLISMIMNF